MRRRLALALLLVFGLVPGCASSDEGRKASSDASTPPRDAAFAAASCKRGLAYGHDSKADLGALRTSVAWWYNWTDQPDTALQDGSYRALGVEYVPMVWGAPFDVNTVVAEIPDDVTTLLGFNEPNFGKQANLSATAAAALWPDVERIADAKGGLRLVSPAVNFCGDTCVDPDPFHYLDAFFAACPGCRVDAIAVHIYVGCNAGAADPAKWLLDHLHTYETRFTQPIWVTEFACTDATGFGDQIAFLEDAVSALEADPRVERYAWFSGRFPDIPYVDLLGADGELTPLGQAYVAAPKNAACTR